MLTGTRVASSHIDVVITMTDRIRGRARAERNARILRRNPVCYICGDPIDLTIPSPEPMSGEVDHVIALARGGTEDGNNLRPSHRACNRAKSDKLYAPNIIRRSNTLTRPATTTSASRRAARPAILDEHDDDEDDDDDDPDDVAS